MAYLFGSMENMSRIEDVATRRTTIYKRYLVLGLITTIHDYGYANGI
jgi:hypothetical protein